MPFEGSFEDRLALRDLLYTYADAVNRADSEAWAATWDEGSLLSLPGFGIFEGKATIVDTWRAAMRAFPDIVFRAWPGLIEVREEKAAMRSYTEEIFLRDGALHRTLGIYDDVCRRVDGRWLFAERRFRPLPQLSRTEVQA
ncbi:MAG: nuclear transport factor 2 family protein [Sphingopyxis granuli]|uniref:nuclear transport factor 2 family protein n=1 Tax=Sphingopyxis granuli TaxID=267128 RepID=UPI003C775ABA